MQQVLARSHDLPLVPPVCARRLVGWVVWLVSASRWDAGSFRSASYITEAYICRAYVSNQDQVSRGKPKRDG